MCKQCITKPVYEFTNKRKLCKRCFIRYFHKKAMYIIRKFKMIRKGNVIGYKKRKNFRDVVLEDILKMYADKAMIKLTNIGKFSRKSPRKKVNKIAIASTIDLEAREIIYKIIKGNIENLKKNTPVHNKIIKPLYLFLDEEVLLYAKLKKLKFKKIKEKKNKISTFINNLEKKHPEIKRAIVNSYLNLLKR